MTIFTKDVPIWEHKPDYIIYNGERLVADKKDWFKAQTRIYQIKSNFFIELLSEENIYLVLEQNNSFLSLKEIAVGEKFIPLAKWSLKQAAAELKTYFNSE